MKLGKKSDFTLQIQPTVLEKELQNKIPKHYLPYTIVSCLIFQ